MPEIPGPSALGRLADRLLPPRDAVDGQERLRAELVLSFDLVFIAIGLSVLFVIHFIYPLPLESQRLARATVPMLVLGLAASAACLRKETGRHLAAQATIGTTFVVLIVSTAFHDGIHSPVLCLWALLPIIAGILAGKKASLAWAGVSFAFVLGLYLAESSGLFIATPIEPTTYPASLLINMAIACGSSAAAVALYETINANLRRRLAHERERYQYEADHDDLTGLSNRRLFVQLSDRSLARARRLKQKVALFLVDLDRFKPVNDELGHPAGDQVLRAVAKRLAALTRESDAVARIGGDEFSVLVELIDSSQAAETLARRLSASLERPVQLGNGQLAEISASIGVALFPDDGDDLESLTAAADQAMYAAKAAGGRRFHMVESPEKLPR